MDLKNKVALITGGARGLGKAYAEAILEAGGKVSLLDVLSKEGEETNNAFKKQYGSASSLFIKCDITNIQEFQSGFRDTKKFFGRLDIVINNAGIYKSSHECDKLTVDINFTAVIKGTYLALDYLRKDKGGQGGIIVNIASILALNMPSLESAVVYAASKCAVLGFTKCLAMTIGEPSVAGHGVTVTCLCPGPSPSHVLREAMEEDVIATAMRDMGIVENSHVVAGCMKLLGDSNNHGGVLSATREGLVYHYPEHLTK